jgi:hypothetical protein
MELKPTNRKQARIRLALQGPSGSGKTYSALMLAYGISQNWSKIAVIDTEHQSAHLYSHLGVYQVLALGPPYSPERFIEAINTCEDAGMDVIIIDSLSHEWEGDGGILDTHAQMVGNSFTNWSKLTPRHNSLIQRVLSSGKHVIATFRSKQDYVLSDKNGRSVPEKVGMKAVARDGVEYDFTVVFELDIYHNATCTKDRTQLFNINSPFKISDKIGEQIHKWCKEAEPVSDQEAFERITACKTIAELNHLHKHNPALRRFATYFNAKAFKLREEVEASNQHLSTGQATHA